MLLGQFGLSHELFGEPLIPVGTVYDPFICRGLDALIYALYIRRVHPRRDAVRVTPGPEGGAHQSTITPSLGIELPEPALLRAGFAREVEWSLLEALRGVARPAARLATYLRLSHRPVDQALAEPVRARLGEDELRRQVLRGGYRLHRVARGDADLPADAPVVQIVAPRARSSPRPSRPSGSSTMRGSPPTSSS